MGCGVRVTCGSERELSEDRFVVGQEAINYGEVVDGDLDVSACWLLEPDMVVSFRSKISGMLQI